MPSVRTYPAQTESCPHRGDHFPLTTRVDTWVYSEAHQAMICPQCGTPAVPSLGGRYHRETAAA